MAMNGYICFYKNQRTEVYAETMFKAKDQAIKHFKVGPKQEQHVHVHLAEKNGEPVIHTAID